MAESFIFKTRTLSKHRFPPIPPLPCNCTSTLLLSKLLVCAGAGAGTGFYPNVGGSLMQLKPPETPWGLFPGIGTYDQALGTLVDRHRHPNGFKNPGSQSSLLLKPGTAVTNHETEFTCQLAAL